VSGSPHIDVFSARECGWLRRKDLESLKPQSMRRCEIWEKPDGGLVVHDAERGPLLVTRFADGRMRSAR
jgi:hypothetical protein